MARKNVEQIERDVIIRLCKQISDGIKELDRKPHEFFFPGELDLIKSRSPQIQNAAKCEMNQAAAAMLLSAETEIQLLKIRTEKAFQEWMEMFQDYKKLLDRLLEHMEMYSRHPLETPAGSFYLAEEDLNYWSKDLYGQVYEKIRQMKQYKKRIQKE